MEGNKTRTVAIAGCGPAGVVAATLLAKRGFQVHVFEKRGDPVTSSAQDDRAFVVGLNAKGVRALTEAGYDLERMVQPKTGVVQFSSLLLRRQSIFPWSRKQEMRRKPGSEMRLGSRAAWVTEMFRQAAELHPKGIIFHWNCAIEDADLEHRLLRVREASGASTTLRYDLLIGADGAYSKVRAAMEAQIDGMAVKLEPSERRYKVFRGLELEQPEGGQAAAPAMVFMPSLPPNNPKSGVLFVIPQAEGGRAVGILSIQPEGWDSLASAEDHLTFLSTCFPTLPPAWAPQIAAEFAVNKQHVAGWRVESTHLAGPGVVLIGDAGHAVTPTTGNGMNSALDDAWILSRILSASGDDLEALPARFEAARREDAAALLWLDRRMLERLTDPRGSPLGFFAFNFVQRPLRRLLHAATGGYVALTPWTYVSDCAEVRYSAAKAMFQRDDALTAGAAALALAGAAALAVRLLAPHATG